MCGLDPMAGWERTPGELIEYIEAHRERMRRRREELGALAYLLGVHTARSVWGKGELGWLAFRGFLPMPEQDADALLAVCEAWANYEPGGE